MLCTTIENIDTERFQLVAMVGRSGHLASRTKATLSDIIIPECDLTLPNLANLKSMCEVLYKIQPDLVHCNGPVALSLLAALVLSDTPIIQHVHVVPDPRLYVEQFTAADTIVSRMNVDAGKIRVIYNSIDDTRLRYGQINVLEARRELGIPTGRFIVVYPARLVEGKRHSVLLSALHHVTKLGHDVHLVLAGESTRQEIWPGLISMR